MSKLKNAKKMKNKILIVDAHPDDEVLGCGGTIAKYTKKGVRVYCLFLGRGKTSRFGAGNNPNGIKKEQTVLEKEAQKAARILGISQIIFKDFPDQKYDTVPFLEIVKTIERIKNKIKPDIIFTHYFGDLNLDHQITFKAVLTACRPVRNESIRKIYSFEVLSSTEWGIDRSFSPNVFVDIKGTFNKKIKALRAYKSEIQKYPHPRSPRAIEILARRWGTIVGKELIEAFELIREIK